MRVVKFCNKVGHIEFHVQGFGDADEVHIAFSVALIDDIGHIVGIDAHLMSVNYKFSEIHFRKIYVWRHKFTKTLVKFQVERHGGIGRRTKSTGALPSRKGYSNQKAHGGSSPPAATNQKQIDMKRKITIGWLMETLLALAGCLMTGESWREAVK